MNIRSININLLKPYEQNTKIHTPEQVDMIANSIQQFGFRQPIVIDKNNVVVVGHGRLKAAKKLGLAEIPCVVIDDLTEDEIKAYRIVDNKANESEWDFAMLDEELKDINYDMADFGFDEFEDFGTDDYEEFEEPEDERSASFRHNVFENQELVQFPITNKYGFPDMKPTYTTGNKFIRFCDWKETDERPEDVRTLQALDRAIGNHVTPADASYTRFCSEGAIAGAFGFDSNQMAMLKNAGNMTPSQLQQLSNTLSGTISFSNSYTSTSANRSLNAFKNPNNSQSRGFIFERKINVPQGTHAYAPRGNAQESEVIFGRKMSTQFMGLSIASDGHIVIHEMYAGNQ